MGVGIARSAPLGVFFGGVTMPVITCYTFPARHPAPAPPAGDAAAIVRHVDAGLSVGGVVHRQDAGGPPGAAWPVAGRQPSGDAGGEGPDAVRAALAADGRRIAIHSFRFTPQSQKKDMTF